MILLDSVYINNSGGKVLLDYLIISLFESGADVFYLLDSRNKNSYSYLPEERTQYMSSIWQRHQFYKKEGKKFSKVLCFGNIPPTIKLNAQVYTYFHNVLLVEQPEHYPFIQKVVKNIKGYFIKLQLNNNNTFIVQSENVKDLLMHHFNLKANDCLVIPFYKPISLDTIFQDKKDEFVYISNANAHKNHTNLLKAWELLYNKGFKLPLHLTVTENYTEVINLIKAYQSKGIPIINHGFIDVAVLYRQCKYSIYPSYTESFGLGLIESIESKSEVIASDLPYVNAIIEPLGKFNAKSPESIVNCVIDSINQSKNNQTIVSKSKISNEITKLIELLQK